MSESVPNSGAEQGGQGGAEDKPPSRSEMRLIEKALRDRFPITPAIRQLVVNQMTLVVGNSTKERSKVAAARVLLLADQVNYKRDHDAEGPSGEVVINNTVATSVLVVEVEKDSPANGQATNGRAP